MPLKDEKPDLKKFNKLIRILLLLSENSECNKLVIKIENSTFDEVRYYDVSEITIEIQVLKIKYLRETAEIIVKYT